MNRMQRAGSLVTLIAASWTAHAAATQDPKPQHPKPTTKTVATDERAAVQRAALDYVEALYDAKPELIQRSVHPELKKFGFYRPEGQTKYRGGAMTFGQLVKLAGSWNKEGKRADARSPKKVEVLDLMDATAVVKLTAVWGIDHMQLAKYDGRWQILHILWQSHPPKK